MSMPQRPKRRGEQNAELRAQMRERGNYYAEIEAAAYSVLKAVGHHGGPLSQRVMVRWRTSRVRAALCA
jgi:hypothetical protein